jgi:hypothetical protein
MEADMSPALVLRGLLLKSDRVARFKRFMISSAPVFVSGTRLFPEAAMPAALLDPRVRADLGELQQ